MEFLYHFKQIFINLYQMNIFELTKVKLNGPERKTKHATVYLIRGFTFIGFRQPSKYLLLFIFWSIFINGFVTVYMPIGFFLSFLTRLNAFSPSEFLTSLQISVNCFGCSAKLIVFYFLHKRLMKATNYMDQLDLSVNKTEDKQQIRKIVAFCNRSQFMYFMLYISYAFFTFLTAVLNGRPPYQLYNPLMEWTDGTWHFFMQTLMEYIMINIHCYQQVVLDSYPIIYITIIRTHLQLLARRISELGRDSKLNSDERYEALVQCILDHKNIMLLYNEFAPVVSGTMFIQFMIIGLILGIATIHVVLFTNLMTTISIILFVISILAETFPCSYLANCLKDDSDSISLAIFHSDWPNEEQRYRRIVPFFLQNTQKTLLLTAMKIFPITMNSNINVVKFAFSVYTFLKHMDFGQNTKATSDK